MTDLLDVNVWLALVDENHIHHARATDYWQNESLQEVAFCRVTALGFLRLSTHPNVLSRPLTCDEAWNVYDRYRSQADVVFIDDSASIDLVFRELSCEVNFIHHLWTDAYLVALAQFKNCRIVSFDKDFQRFPELDFLHLSVREFLKICFTCSVGSAVYHFNRDLAVVLFPDSSCVSQTKGKDGASITGRSI